MLSMIVATDLEGAIGNKGDLLYHNPEDLKRFKILTTGHAVVMGRKTFESLPNKQPLKNRINIVITRDIEKLQKQYEDRDIYICSLETFDTLYSSLKEEGSTEDIFIIGGAEIYKHFLPQIDKIYLTKFYENNKEADTFLDIPMNDFDIMYRSEKKFDYDNFLAYQFIDLERKQNKGGYKS